MKRWIDPDNWGRFIWSVLFSTTMNNNNSENNLLWMELIQLLTHLLPCFACRMGLAQFLQHHHNNLNEVKTTEQKQIFLQSLYNDIQKRNNNNNTTIIISRFKKRFLFSQLFYLDLFMCFACIFITADENDNRDLQYVQRFIILIKELVAYELNIALPEIKQAQNIRQIWNIVMSSPKCDYKAIQSLLSTIEIHHR